MYELTHLDLFAGIGGFSLGLEGSGFKSTAFSEIDREAECVYRAHFPDAVPIGDISRVDWPEFLRAHGAPYIASGGVPCQPASTLGHMRGTADERWLWPEVIRMVREVRPRYCIFENPPALLTLEGGSAFNGIVSGLVALGYDLWWDVFPAAAFGAGHLRERCILVCANAGHATASAEPQCQREEMGRQQLDRLAGCSQDVAHAEGIPERIPADEADSLPDGRESWQESPGRRDCGVPADSNGQGLERLGGDGQGENRTGGGSEESRRPVAPPDLRGRVNCEDWWHETHTGIPVLAHGIPSRLVEASCRCFGNAVMPQIPFIIGKAILETEGLT